MNAGLRKSVIDHLRSGHHMRAILAIRQSTGADLKQAIAKLKELEHDTTPAELYAEDHMGMTSDIVAIERFSRAIVDYLEYPPKFYSDTREGAPILRTLFEVLESSARSRELAACFGIDPWGFNQHELDPACTNLAKLREMFGDEEVAAFDALREADFKFYFRPNG